LLDTSPRCGLMDSCGRYQGRWPWLIYDRTFGAGNRGSPGLVSFIGKLDDISGHSAEHEIVEGQDGIPVEPTEQAFWTESGGLF
jgi:hypothetical protein